MTNLTGSLAFVVFGVGLDDPFIIMGEYSRTDPRKDPVQRVIETMEVVGLSIFVTTLTTMMAFGLGTMSDVPAIRWLCYYALPTIFIDFIFQIGFFISLLVLDERRIQQNRRDCCVCVTAKRRGRTDTSSSDSLGDDGKRQEGDLTRQRTASESDWSDGDSSVPPITYQERFMIHYVDFLMRTPVKVLVIVGFIAYAGLAMWSATLLEQEFKAEEIVPDDSYVKGFLSGVNEYSVQVVPIAAYFRDVDQSDPHMQHEMRDYISALGNLPQIGEEPPFCWVQILDMFDEYEPELAAKIKDLASQVREFNQEKTDIDEARWVHACAEPWEQHF